MTGPGRVQFGIEPTMVRRRSRLPALLVVLAVIGVIAAAIATTGVGSDGRGRATAGPVEAAATSGAAIVADGSEQDGLPAPSVPGVQAGLPGPEAIDCHELSPTTCASIAISAVAILPADAQPVTAIGVWDTILCGDDFDCPPTRLAGNRPLGSAIVTIGSGTSAWINVLDSVPGPGRVSHSNRTVAWVLRWVP
jgi:hypothetical protein